MPHMPLVVQQLPMLPRSGIMMLGQLGSTCGGRVQAVPDIMPHVPVASSAQHAVPPSRPPPMHVVEPHGTDITIMALPPPPPALLPPAPPLPIAPPLLAS